MLFLVVFTYLAIQETVEQCHNESLQSRKILTRIVLCYKYCLHAGSLTLDHYVFVNNTDCQIYIYVKQPFWITRALRRSVSVLCVLPERIPDRARWRFGPLPPCFLAGMQIPCSASQTEGWGAEWTWPASCTQCKNRPMKKELLQIVCACIYVFVHVITCARIFILTWSDWCHCHQRLEISASGPECGSHWWRWWSSPTSKQMKSCQNVHRWYICAYSVQQLQSVIFV